MLVIKKLWLWILCIYSILHQAIAASIHDLGDSPNQEMESMEYEAEDSAREQLLSDKDYKWKSLKMETSTPSGDLKPQEGIRLCTKKGDKLSECRRGRDNWPVCVGEKSGEIRACSKFNQEDVPVPVCRETASNKVITCGGHTKAFLCLHEDNGTTPLQPCKFESRHACLGKKGDLEKCSQKDGGLLTSIQEEEAEEKDILYEAFKNDTDWQNWWKPYVNSHKKIAPKKPSGALCKKANSTDDLIECGEDSSNSTVCIHIVDGFVDACSEFQMFGLGVPLCLESKSRNVTTCGFVTIAYLCWPAANESSIARPCSDQKYDRHMCLSDKGRLVLCSNMTEPVGQVDIQSETSHSEAHLNVSWRKEELVCLSNDDTSVLQRCHPQASNPVACLNTNKWIIENCRDIQIERQLGIAVCIETNGELFTCKEVSRVDLCYTPEDRVEPCEGEFERACFDANGRVDKCSNIPEDKVLHISDPAEDPAEDKSLSESNEVDGTVPFVVGGHDVEKKEYEKLCVSKNSKYGIAECQHQKEPDYACLVVPNEGIRSCSVGGKLKIPVCKKIENKEIMTCGAFNKINLCLSDSDGESSVVPCKMSDERVACFKGGKIQHCSTKNATAEEQESKVDMPESGKEIQQYFDFRNSRKVFRAENRSINAIMKGNKRLCDNELEKKVMSCDKDPEVNFLCLAAISGDVKMCKIFTKPDFVIPLCIKKESRKVVTCGKFSTGPVCTLDAKTKGVCTKEKKGELCLTKLGELKDCTEYDANEGDSDYSDGDDDSNDTDYNDYDIDYDGDVDNADEDNEDENVASENKDGNEVQDASYEDMPSRISDCIISFPENHTDIVPPEEDGGNVTSKEFGKEETYSDYYDNGEIDEDDDVVFDAEYDDDSEAQDSEYGDDGISKDEEDNDSGKKKGDKMPWDSSSEEQNEEDERKSKNQEDNDSGKQKRDKMPWDSSSSEQNEEDDGKSKNEEDRDSGKQKRDKMPRDSNRRRKYRILDEKQQDGDDGKKMLWDSSESDFSQFVSSLEEYEIGRYRSQEAGSGSIKRRRTREDTPTQKYADEPSNEMETRDDDEEQLETSDDKEESSESAGSEDKNSKDVKKKVIALSSNIHMLNTHLCKRETKDEKLINCDKVKEVKFACIGASSRQIKMCDNFGEDEIALPVCFQAVGNCLVTCDIFSNVNLCLSGKKPMYPCKDEKDYACLGNDSIPARCQDVQKGACTRELDKQQSPKDEDTDAQFPRDPAVVEHPDNERFYHLHCTNCTIENKLVVIGTPEGVLPETEFFTFPST